MLFSDNQNFKNLLLQKKQDILQRTSDGVQETAQFQRMLSLLRVSSLKYKHNDFKIVIISKKDLLNLDVKAEEKTQILFQDSTFIQNKIIYVDSSFNILNSDNEPLYLDNNEARRYYSALSVSDEDWVVFHIAPNAIINYFIDGKDYGGGIFYTYDAQKSYEKLKTINELEEVFNDYRISLTKQDTYLKFFVKKSALRALHSLMRSKDTLESFLNKYQHLLANKPEELFREDMRNYIIQHTNVHVAREVTMDNLDRLDIELQDEAGHDLYFIEIKWVGVSIHANGDQIGTEYDASRIKPKAIEQVARYIDELLIKENKNIVLGYLAVFDARKEDDLPDTGEGITEEDLPEELRKYYSRCKKLKDFRVKNINPR